MISHPIPAGCSLCIDGFAPAGLHPILGAIFLLCLACDPPCPHCHGDAMFPAYGLFNGPRLHDALTKAGLFVVTCDLCGGITAIAPINRKAHP